MAGARSPAGCSARTRYNGGVDAGRPRTPRPPHFPMALACLPAPPPTREERAHPGPGGHPHRRGPLHGLQHRGRPPAHRRPPGLPVGPALPHGLSAPTPPALRPPRPRSGVDEAVHPIRVRGAGHQGVRGKRHPHPVSDRGLHTRAVGRKPAGPGGRRGRSRAPPDGAGDHARPGGRALGLGPHRRGGHRDPGRRREGHGRAVDPSAQGQSGDEDLGAHSPQVGGASCGRRREIPHPQLESRDIAYAGAKNGGRLIEEPSESRQLGTDFDRIGRIALSQDETNARICHQLEVFSS
ncbi:hypothetical protein EDD29_4718 [Actinocorallia herbida]|uniref:Uncharacterized protein n=1 Tax=Actinocorallia herbida TaxID=58109 RepID=A0A3N1D0S1_9ACTN|nr:hypothetical protein EDD29_4718 [Actinocorallia herbida]